MNKHFDIDLTFGEQGERWLTLLADERKIEVKRDRMWPETRNLFFEFRYKGEPSGISVTTADYFAYILTHEGENVATFLWEVSNLRAGLKRLHSTGKARIVSGGDGNNSEGFLVSLDSIGELI
jgi:hypothetical protein